jgi:hypothetical protein
MRGMVHALDQDNAGRVSGIPPRGPHRELKLNLVVLADCEPTSA